MFKPAGLHDDIDLRLDGGDSLWFVGHVQETRSWERIEADDGTERSKGRAKGLAFLFFTSKLNSHDAQVALGGGQDSVRVDVKGNVRRRSTGPTAGPCTWCLLFSRPC